MKFTLPLLLILACQISAWADRSAPLLDLASPGVLSGITPNKDTVTVGPGPEVRIAVSEAAYPGVVIKPAQGGVFDLSTFGHVQAQVTNTGTKLLALSLRVDNDGDWKQNPWNAEAVRVKPGESGTVKVYFGQSFGKPGFALNPAVVNQVSLFATKSDMEQSFRIDSLQSAGSPGEKPSANPATVRIRPKDGVILGPGVPFDPAKQTAVRSARAGMEAGVLRLNFPPSQGEPAVTIKPAEGKWDLSQALQVRLKIRNAGGGPVTPGARLEGGGATDTIAAPSLAPGAETEIVVPFGAQKPVDLAKKENTWKFSSADVTGLVVSAGPGTGERVLDVISVSADVPATEMPAWLGRRPPVDGDWTLTLEENFDGGAINENIWMFKANNYWDANKTHFTRENVIVGGGTAALRYEKKEGFHNDDPAGAKTPYAVGYLRTYDKWTQRYGYFESRLKIPRAPGLWPDFWLVPDRGPSAGDGAKRQDTKDGGMEFDIMENLTRWGPYRYNIALHWDGYGKEHQALGSDKIYAQPDKDGFITSGMLWLPGLVAFYVNGREVARWENERVAEVPAYIIYYMPSGGWDNNQTEDGTLPADFVIDYVKVWQRKDLASDVDRN